MTVILRTRFLPPSRMEKVCSHERFDVYVGCHAAFQSPTSYALCGHDNNEGFLLAFSVEHARAESAWVHGKLSTELGLTHR